MKNYGEVVYDNTICTGYQLGKFIKVYIHIHIINIKKIA